MAAQPTVAPGPNWSTGLCDCCAEPGGCGLCFITSCCGCFVLGKNGEYAGNPGGYWGSCVGGLIPIVGNVCNCMAALNTLKKKNGGVEPQSDQCMLFVENCFCGACVACRTYREQQLMGGPSGYMPGNAQSAAMLKDNKKPSYNACAFD